MAKLTLKQVADFTGGEVYGEPDLEISGVQIDSRKVNPGDLFVALKGERTDGHLFVTAALAKGAVALVGQPWARVNFHDLPPGSGAVAVKDTLTALQQLAHRYRQSFAIPVIGVTGSVGKTTTKDMIAAVLGESLNVHKTAANFNNELGLPLTLLGLESFHRAAVVEMGMRGLGEIAFLASLAEPTIGVITNIGTTHLELLGTQENIARAKGELLQALPATGEAVLNGDDPWCRRLGEQIKCRKIYYSADGNSADVTAHDIVPWGDQGTKFIACYQDESVEVLLPLPGKHNVANALAALSVGVSLGLDLEACARGLANLQLTAMRLELCPGPWQSTIINDTYNANPASTKASLEVLAERGAKSPKIAVLGSMFELGAEEESGHKQVGAYAASIHGLTLLVTVGELGRFIAQGAREAGMDPQRIHSFNTTQEAVDFLTVNPVAGSWILVKGSRGMKMERVVEGLKNI